MKLKLMKIFNNISIVLGIYELAMITNLYMEKGFSNFDIFCLSCIPLICCMPMCIYSDIKNGVIK